MAIVDLYRCIWHNGRHNNANRQQNTNFVVAAPDSKAEVLASTIQTNNGDNQAVTVDQITVIQKGIIQ